MPILSKEWPSDFDLGEYSQGRFEPVLMPKKITGGTVTVEHKGKQYKFRRFQNLPSNEVLDLVHEGDVLICYNRSIMVDPGYLYIVKRVGWDTGIYVTQYGVDEKPRGYNGSLGEPGTDGFRGAFGPVFVPIGSRILSFKDERFKDAFV